MKLSANRGSQLKMFDKLKPGFNAFLRPAMKFFARMGVHPNHITILGVVFFAGAGFLSALGIDYWLWAFALLVLGSFMDGIDGQLAREYGKKSVFGSILDSSCDRITEILFLAGLLVFYMHNLPELRKWGVYLCYATIAGSVMVSYVKACCDGVGVKCKRGFMQRPERLFLFGTGLVFPAAMLWILGLISLLCAVTAMERLISAAIQCKRNAEAS